MLKGDRLLGIQWTPPGHFSSMRMLPPHLSLVAGNNQRPAGPKAAGRARAEIIFDHDDHAIRRHDSERPPAGFDVPAILMESSTWIVERRRAKESQGRLIGTSGIERVVKPVLRCEKA